MVYTENDMTKKILTKMHMTVSREKLSNNSHRCLIMAKVYKKPARQEQLFIELENQWRRSATEDIKCVVMDNRHLLLQDNPT